MDNLNSPHSPKILMLDSTGSWRGGETQVWLLSRGLVDKGYQVILATRGNELLAKKVERLGVRVFPISISGGLDITSAYRLRRFLKKESFGLIHAHTSHAHSCAFLATLGHRARPALLVSRRVAFPSGKGAFSRLKYGRGADVFIAISNAVKMVLISGGVPDKKVKVIPSAVDLSLCTKSFNRREILSEFSLNEGNVIIGTVGALTANKAQDDFLRAAQIISRKIAEARFIIVGEGKMRRSLEKLASTLGIANKVLFTGFLEDVHKVMSMLDCFVISSLLEGLCTSIMIAQVMGIPVVATETAGIPELIRDREDGLLVPTRNPSRIAEAVLWILSNDDQRIRCIENAKKKAEGYDSSGMVERTIEVYEELLLNGSTLRFQG